MAKYIDLDVAVKAFNNFDAGRACGTHSTLLTPEEFAEYLYELPAADVAPMGWISVKDKLPEPETEVLAVCVRNGYRFICPVIFEDGTMLTQNSMWNWYELENYGTYSEENDDYFVPEGWWENRQFTPDDIYNNPVDCTVTHWMPLPEPPKED